MPYYIYYHIIHKMPNEINDLIIVNLLIFSQTFSKVLEHFSGINLMSAAEHCKLRHVSTELK